MSINLNAVYVSRVCKMLLHFLMLAGDKLANTCLKTEFKYAPSITIISDRQNRVCFSQYIPIRIVIIEANRVTSGSPLNTRSGRGIAC